MTDEDLFKLVKQAHRDAVRIPPGVREIADAMWQASRRAALEEAAKSFELFFKRNDELDAGYVADSIRALAQKEVGENP